MSDAVRRLMLRELAAFEREVSLFPDDASLFRTVPGIANSAGNLALHVCGSLKHFVGAVLGDTGYVRNRDAEFAAKSGTRADVAAQLRETAEVVSSTLKRLPADALARPYPKPPGDKVSCELWLTHLAVHIAMHLGQAGYLRRMVTGDTRSSNPVAIAELPE
jgi:hypothetical protein